MDDEKIPPVACLVGHHSIQGSRKTMEDEVVIKEGFTVGGDSCLQGPLSMYAVLDGHGGKAAATFTKERIHSVLSDHLKTSTDPGDALCKAYLQIDKEFLAREPRDASGTTAVCALLHHSTRRLWVANAGDSRCVVCTSGLGKALSRDHKASDPAEAERIRKAGGYIIRNRVMGCLAVSRAIGDADYKAEDMPFVTAEPEVTLRKLIGQDEYMVLACDGLFDVMSNKDICYYVSRDLKAKKLAPPEASKKLANHAVGNRGSKDNVSVVIVKFVHNEPKADGDEGGEVGDSGGGGGDGGDGSVEETKEEDKRSTVKLAAGTVAE